MATDPGHSLSRRFVPNLAAFLVGLALAWFLEWETTDLVWSLWLSSLVIGYLTILIRIGFGAKIGSQVIFDDGFTGPRWVVGLIGVGGVLFLLGFFSLHFCGFHAGHSVFLNLFFPLPGLPETGFGEAFMNPFLLWKGVFQHLMNPYGWFLIPALVAERKGILGPFRNTTDPDFFATAARKDAIGDMITGPYRNVIRMHLLIFFFGGCHFLQIDSFAIYVVVSAVYFFPWSELKAWRSERGTATGDP